MSATEPEVFTSPTLRLARIAKAHLPPRNLVTDRVLRECRECTWQWPCPTYVWATEERDASLPWDPAGDP